MLWKICVMCVIGCLVVMVISMVMFTVGIIQSSIYCYRQQRKSLSIGTVGTLFSMGLLLFTMGFMGTFLS